MATDSLTERFEAMAGCVASALPPQARVAAMRVMVATANEAPWLIPRAHEFLRTQLSADHDDEYLVDEITRALAQLRA
jgi:hypothetical protein